MPRRVKFRFESVSREPLRQTNLGEVPRRRCVFRIFDRNGNLILLDKTHNLASRLKRFYSESPEPGAIDLRRISDRIEYCTTDSPFESRYLLYRERRRCFPTSYRRMKTFPLYHLIELDPTQRFPRIDTCRRMRPGLRYFGPFRTRADVERARTAAERTFRLRPCEYDIRGDQPYPDCLYFQMETCSRPCNGDISRSEYLRDVEGAISLIQGHGEASLEPLRQRIQALAEETRFEEAEQLRLQMERAGTGHPEAQHRIFDVDRFDFAVLLKARSSRNRKIVVIRSGRILRIEEHACTEIEGTLAASLGNDGVHAHDDADNAGVAYDEFCLSASFLLRPLRSALFFPLTDPSETSAAVAAHLRKATERPAETRKRSGDSEGNHAAE